MAPVKEHYTPDEVERLIDDARMEMRISFLDKEFRGHKESEEQTLADILAKIDLIMSNEQVRAKELTAFRGELKKEISEDFVTKAEFKTIRNSIVLAVSIIVAIGGFVQWFLSTSALVAKLAGISP
jgi:hypothetical protein